MITAVIIDNEVNSINYLKALIRDKAPEIHLLGEATGVKGGIELIQRTQPSLVFLDIELGSLTGFDLIHQIGKINFSLVFITAHEHYALRAIKFAALDFLLKPVLAEELETAITRVVEQNKITSLEKKINLLLENRHENGIPKKIAITTATHTAVIEIKNIIYLQANGPGPYTSLYLRNGAKIVSSKILKEYEELLTEFGFCRIHRSSLVNLSEIDQLVTKSSGGYVLMSDNTKVDISDRKKKELMNKLSSKVISC